MLLNCFAMAVIFTSQSKTGETEAAGLNCLGNQGAGKLV